MFVSCVIYCFLFSASIGLPQHAQHGSRNQMLSPNVKYQMQNEKLHAMPVQICPKEWELGDNACYKRFNLNVSFGGALNQCKQNYGSHLVMVNNNQKLNVLQNFIASSDPSIKKITWVGLEKKRENEWKWLDQTPLTRKSTDLAWCENDANINLEFARNKTKEDYQKKFGFGCATIVFTHQKPCLMEYSCDAFLHNGFVCELYLRTNQKMAKHSLTLSQRNLPVYNQENQQEYQEENQNENNESYEERNEERNEENYQQQEQEYERNQEQEQEPVAVLDTKHYKKDNYENEYFTFKNLYHTSFKGNNELEKKNNLQFQRRRSQTRYGNKFVKKCNENEIEIDEGDENYENDRYQAAKLFRSNEMQRQGPQYVNYQTSERNPMREYQKSSYPVNEIIPNTIYNKYKKVMEEREREKYAQPKRSKCIPNKKNSLDREDQYSNEPYQRPLAFELDSNSDIYKSDQNYLNDYPNQMRLRERQNDCDKTVSKGQKCELEYMNALTIGRIIYMLGELSNTLDLEFKQIKDRLNEVPY